jgi:prepilin-type N-terminal cleavage/methylation domain-containing protein
MQQIKKQKGFTLVELAIVIILVGIVISLVFSTRDPIDSIKVGSQADRLVADLRYMQHFAMTRNERMRINFSSNQYTLTKADGTTAVDQPGSPNNVVIMPSGVTLSTNLPSNYVVFDGKGRPYTDNGTPGTLLGATATITFNSSAGNESVTIAPQTGRISKP